MHCVARYRRVVARYFSGVVIAITVCLIVSRALFCLLVPEKKRCPSWRFLYIYFILLIPFLLYVFVSDFMMNDRLLLALQAGRCTQRHKASLY